LYPCFLLIDLSTEPGDIQSLKKDPWNIIIIECWKGMNFLVLPLFIILVTTLIPQAEHRNHTWKQVFASPIVPIELYLAKFKIIQQLIIIVLILFNLAALLVAIAINYIDPSVNLFAHKPDWYNIARISFNTYLSVLGMSALQYIIAMRFKNFLIPVGCGFCLWLMIPVALELHWDHLNKFPYAYSIFVLFPKYASILPYILWASLGMHCFSLLSDIGISTQEEPGEVQYE
jgi:lantibiotic transport system permease protein